MKLKIPFNRPAIVGGEQDSVQAALLGERFSGSGPSVKECETQIRLALDSRSALLVPSCTAALEMAALIIDIQPGDEVIMPSYTFVSTANAFALRGAKICFVDIDPSSMAAGADQIAPAISKKTKAVVTVPYNGVMPEPDRLRSLLSSHAIPYVEDAAQSWGATYRGQSYGTFGDLSCFSFHETKNIHCGEGGALVVHRSEWVQKAEVLKEKGTNRSQFLRGDIDKYTWQGLGSSYLLSELQGAFLKVQLLKAEAVTARRTELWRRYADRLSVIQQSGRVELQSIPANNRHNGHLFFLKARDLEEREALKRHLLNQGIQTAPHYEPLHVSPAGRKYGYFSGEDRFTSAESARLLRLPLFYALTDDELDRICDETTRFFS